MTDERFDQKMRCALSPLAADTRLKWRVKQKMEEEIGYLRKEIAKLPEKYRIPICLFYLENMPQEEIAKAMKIPVGTVKQCH